MRHFPLRLLAGLFLLIASPLSAQQHEPAELPRPGMHHSDTLRAPLTEHRADALEGDSDAFRTGNRIPDSLIVGPRRPRMRLRVDWRALAGGSIPIGVFGEQSGARPGFARPGYSLGLDYVIGSESLGWISSFLFSMNPSDVGSTHKAVYVTLELPPTTSVDVGPWYTNWLSTGFQYAIAPITSTRVHAEAQLGVLISRSSDVRFKVEGVEFRQAPSWAGSVCVALGMGAQVADRVMLIGRYMFATPTYDLYITGPNDLSIHNLYDQPTSVVQILAGFSF